MADNDVNFCDLCCEPTTAPFDYDDVYLPGSRGLKILNQHLRLYFVVCKLLKCSENDSLNVLTIASGSGGEKILGACGKCEEIISKALQLNKEIGALKSKILELGKDLGDRISQGNLENWNGGANSALSNKLRQVLLEGDGHRDNVKFEVGLAESVSDGEDFDIEASLDFEEGSGQEETLQIHYNYKESLGKESLQQKTRTRGYNFQYADQLADKTPVYANEVSETENLSNTDKSKSYTISSDSNFHCNSCESVYTSFTGIKKHERMHKESNLLGNIYDCTICHHPNTSMSKLRRHINVIHASQDGIHKSENISKRKLAGDPLKDSGDSDSDYSPEVSYGKVGNKKTKISTDADSNFSCKLCESKFTTIVGFRKHMRMHKASDELGNKYDCPTCRHPTISESNLRRHLTTIHQNDSNKSSQGEMSIQGHESAQISIACPDLDLKISCDTADASEIDSTTYEGRPYRRLSDGNYHCKLCKSVYTSFPGIRKHEQMHEESNFLGNVYDCKVCQHPNTSESNLCRHMKVIHGLQEQNHNDQLKDVGNTEETADASDIDSTTYEGRPYRRLSDGNYHCKLCKSVYTSFSGIRKHEQMHEESNFLGNLYDCKVCQHPNTSESNLCRHMKVIHGLQEQNHNDQLKDVGDTEEGLERCQMPDSINLCLDSETGSTDDRDADATQDLVHEIDTSVSIKTYPCFLCESVYTSTGGYKKHMRIHQESDELGNKYDCSVCRHPTLSESNLSRHITVAHQYLIKNKTEGELEKEGENIPNASSTGKLNFDSLRDVDDLPKTGNLDKSNKSYTISSDLKYHCNSCESVYTSFTGIKKHERMHKESNSLGNIYDCTTCRHPNTSMSNLRRHMNVIHGLRMECDKSENVTTRKIAYNPLQDSDDSDSDSWFPDRKVCNTRKNRLNTDADSNFSCKLCESKFTTIVGFKKHMRMHKASDELGNKYDCPTCRHPTISESNLRRHFTTIHQNESNKSSQGEVPIHRTVDSESSETHETSIEPDLNFSCDSSDASDGDSIADEDILHTRVSDRNYRCKLCKSVYLSFNGIKNHEQMHEESNILGNLYDCKVCQHPNTSESNLYRHMKVIHGLQDQSYKEKLEGVSAEGLDLRCQLPNSINSHINSNTESTDDRDAVRDSAKIVIPMSVKTYPCFLCESVYTSTVGYKKHMRIHQESDELGNGYDCSICRHPSVTEISLRRHLTMAHENASDKKTQEDMPTVPLVKENVQIPTCSSKVYHKDSSDGMNTKTCENKSFTKSLIDGTYHCKFCKSVYTSFTGICKHRRMHKESDLLGNIYDCKICRHPNTSDRRLRRHMSSIHYFPQEKKSPGLSDQFFVPVKVESESLDSEKRLTLSRNAKVATKREKRYTDCNDSHSEEDENKGDENDEDWTPDHEQEEDILDLHLGERAKRSLEAETKDELYHCDKCNVNYKSARGFERHEEEHEASIALGHKYDCHCGFPASSETRLRYHKRQVHCTFRVHGPKNHVHMRKHHSSKVVKRTRRKVKDHRLNTKRSLEKLRCKICKGGSYWYKISYRKHMDDHEKSTLINGIWDCNVCNFPCLTEKQLARHKTKHKRRRETCEICQKVFINSALFKQHRRLHAEYDMALDPTTGLFHCKFCPFVGTSRQGLVAHKAALHKDATMNPANQYLLCTQCGKSFYTQSLLRKHIKNIHENIYTYTCEHCGKGFDNRRTFSNHRMTHEENRTRQYICDICGAAYSHKHSLSGHMSKYHSSLSNEIISIVNDDRRFPKEKEYKCKRCEMVFPYKYLLVSHIPSAHSDVYRFSCDQCDKKYTNPSGLKLHKEITHSDGSLAISCKYCGKKFPHKHYAIGHYKFCKAKKDMEKGDISKSVQNVNDQ